MRQKDETKFLYSDLGLFTFNSVSLGPVTLRPPARRFAPRVPRPVDGDLAQVVRRGDRPPRCRFRRLLGATGDRYARGLRVPPVAVRAAPLLRALRRWRRFARRPAPASSTGRATVRTGTRHDRQEALGVGSGRCRRE